MFPLRTLEYVKEAPFSDAEEAAAAEGAPKDNISRQCRHLLRQRSFYPIFPAPLAGSGLEGVNLDVTHLDLLRFDEVSADVVITPSKLGGQFIKVRRPRYSSPLGFACPFAHQIYHPYYRSWTVR